MNTKFRDILIKHYQKPEAFGFVNDKKGIKIRHNSEFCVDDLILEVILEQEIIKSAKFEGVACMVATSAIDLFCLELTNKTKSEAKKIIYKFEEMLQNADAEIKLGLNNLGYFGLVSNQPNRVRCAIIPAQLFKKIF